jgi:hypothetical protein
MRTRVLVLAAAAVAMAGATYAVQTGQAGQGAPGASVVVYKSPT